MSGRVQGVGFRWATYQVARENQITGSVANLANGQVRIIAQAHSQQLAKFIKAIKASPTPYGLVSQVKIKSIPLVDCSSFTIKKR